MNSWVKQSIKMIEKENKFKIIVCKYGGECKKKPY